MVGRNLRLWDAGDEIHEASEIKNWQKKKIDYSKDETEGIENNFTGPFWIVSVPKMPPPVLKLQHSVSSLVTMNIVNVHY